MNDKFGKRDLKRFLQHIQRFSESGRSIRQLVRAGHWPVAQMIKALEAEGHQFRRCHGLIKEAHWQGMGVTIFYLGQKGGTDNESNGTENASQDGHRSP